MDPNTCIRYGQLVQATYALAPQNGPVPLPAGTFGPLAAQYDPFGIGYTVVHAIYGNELATSVHGGPQLQKPFGLILTTQAGDIVIAIRGTERIWEWLQDFAFLQRPCPFVASGGNTEDGFTDVYESLVVDQTGNSVVTTLRNWQLPIRSIVVCGHSLGAALATLLVLDIAANVSITQNIYAYTYASPLVGDSTFANTYDHVVPFTVRVANQMDIVSKVPFPPFYAHVAELLELNPVSNGQTLVQFSPSCEHSLTTYLYLLSLLPGAIQQQLDQVCQPAPGGPALFALI